MEKIFNLKEINEIAKEIVFRINNLKTKTKKATIISLSGDFGSGKTTLTQEIGLLFGIKQKINSPTFVIMKKYKIKNQKFKELIHLDAYRLKDGKELVKLDWEKIAQNENNLIIIEWPEIVKSCLRGLNQLKVFLKHENKDEKTRKIKIRSGMH
jgi:tRNA threonylcarbamoyladenosine biosynthesis protein TsaE